MIFNEEMKDWMNLAENWSFEADTRVGTGMKLSFRVEELGAGKWQIVVEDPRGEEIHKYEGSFDDVLKKLEQFKIQASKTTRTRESK